MTKQKLLDPKAVRVILFVLITALVAFGLPKPKYQSLDVIKDIAVPMQVGPWAGRDVKTDIQLMDSKYNFIKSLFLREYRHPTGQVIYLYLLDAGNFHNPKVCLTMAGFSMEDLEDIELRPVVPGADAAGTGAPGQITAAQVPFKAKTAMITKGEANFLVSYWITINGKRVDWTEQKVKEFFFSLVGAKKAGLMVRIDTPVTKELIPLARQGIQDFTSRLSAVLQPKDRQLIFGR